MIKSFAEANRVLLRFVPPPRSMRENYTLNRMKALITALGNPQEQFKVLHVAGTSGKTSTAYYLSALLRQTGKKIGTTVSPHIDEINERVQINLTPLAENEFCNELNTFMELVNKLSIKPTYFELLVAFAFWEFARQKVDYAVVEVGLGGLLDGTNVITRPDKVCVLTDIGLDHINVLGTTLPEIAAQKAGIIRKGNAVFTLQQELMVMDVFQNTVKEQRTELNIVPTENTPKLPKDMPLFQRRNWYLAKNVVAYVCQRDGMPRLMDAQVATSTQTHIPARMEVVEKDGKTIIMDGAHNEQKMHALVTSLQAQFPRAKMAVLLGLVSGKNLRVKGVLREILPLASHIIVTSFEIEQDMRKVATDPHKVADFCREMGFSNIVIEPDPIAAYKLLQAQPETAQLVTGSFYLLNHIRPLVLYRT